MDKVIVRLIDLPNTIPAVVEIDAEGDYNVYINAKLSRDESLKAYRHEKRHILKGHFHKDMPVKECEVEANDESGHLCAVLKRQPKG